MTTVKLPSSLEEGVERLGSLDKLITVREWEKAAIVAAFVRLPGRGARREEASNSFFTCDQLAALGIAGLRSKDTVRLYVTRWLDANGGEYPLPGDQVNLPNEAWQSTRTGTNGYDSEEGAREKISKIVELHGPKLIAEAVREPSVAEAVHEDQQASHALLMDSMQRHRGRATPEPPSPHPMDRGIVGAAAADFLARSRELKQEIVRASGTYPWRVNEREQVEWNIREALRLGSEALEMLTTEVTDQALEDLLKAEERGT